MKDFLKKRRFSRYSQDHSFYTAFPHGVVLWYNFAMWSRELYKKAFNLRRQGKTYSEINAVLKTEIPKSTFSCWFRQYKLTPNVEMRIRKNQLVKLHESRVKAHLVLKRRREEYLLSIRDRVKEFSTTLKDRNVGKIVLAMLFITEGRRRTDSVILGNSDPYIISLFLRVLRFCYRIDEEKLRCTVQCRADQDVSELERYWSRVTGIRRAQFCKVQIDSRTIGKPTRKKDYKGVCRLVYYSADIALELKTIAGVIHKGPIVQ